MVSRARREPLESTLGAEGSEEARSPDSNVPDMDRLTATFSDILQGSLQPLHDKVIDSARSILTLAFPLSLSGTAEIW